MHRWLALAFFIIAAFSAAAIGGLATGSSVTTWYLTINKPSWNPPGWIFGPVWSALYLMMAVAAWRVWLKRAEPGAALTLKLWFVQLALNLLWSVLFFGLRRPDLALGEILLLWSLLVVLQFRLARTDRTSAYLWAPYLAWVSFAAFLNFTLWRLN